MADIIQFDAAALSRLIRNKEVSCLETMQAYLRQIDRLNPAANAIVSLRPHESLLDEARQYDDMLANGRYMGWMHGMPQAPKDVTLTRGLRTTFGSPLLKGFVPEHDAPVAARMRAAGAIFIGKTNVPEFALGSQTYNTLFGATRNALNPSLTAGGSSGGAAVALALNMLPVADGSDMMGSLRNPAAFNNVYGLRPSHGRVPSGAPDLFCQQLATDGPMARNITDLAMLLRTQAGRDEYDPFSLRDELPGNKDFLSSQNGRFDNTLDKDFKGCRIGWLGDLSGHLPFEPGVLELCEQALSRFDAVGAQVEAVKPRFSPEQLWDTWLAWRHFLLAGTLGVHYADPKRRAALKPEAVWEVEQGIDMPASRLYSASLARSAIYRNVIQMFEQVDFLVLPAAQVFPFDVDTPWPRQINGQAMDTYHRWMEVTILPSLMGCPALSVPAGLSPTGLPAGLQIIGRPGADWQVLQLGRAWEASC
ncbi:amidase [Pusillimonas sp.]|uniref:amidase n=1 Tax=Pusillimonas sp. TaxID=3040095 RepID=UPI0037CBAB1B